MTANSINQVEGMKALKVALDSEDLAKQIYADASAADRQEHRNHFESRIEFSKQKAQAASTALSALKEYGLQTLRWLFLLNAGAIGAVLTYLAGKYPDVKNAPSIIQSVWPFAAGCLSVVTAGGLAFFNFSYIYGSHPTLEELHNFIDPQGPATWPVGAMRKPGEEPAAFYRRMSKTIDATRIAAVAFAGASALLFALGVLLVGLAATRVHLS